MGLDRTAIFFQGYPQNFRQVVRQIRQIRTAVDDHIDVLPEPRLKGLYDNLGKRRKILVTGSARLDFYRG
ncbi:MAG: hypothetical protein A3G34_17155 [Candidatus Lindowbacteria bacterium RIFCSPLOWO2_12_FULL_62_27]|nr:MAG: hypothetical protein A3G34_17155 [Candidatus Lindowbacteria bacterium RIFCSPLOWO2_12_FULL_62_27]OGH63981.1 MAG: hypothetical protein A3I06_10510 [Candidatus Lindowbacteria bacterium RIFCSPLOWO2_02_FULL_62_12]